MVSALQKSNRIRDAKAVAGHNCVSVVLHKICGTISPAFHHLLMNPMEQVIEPNNIFSASGEFFFIGVGFAWIITLLFEPDVIASNPLKLRYVRTFKHTTRQGDPTGPQLLGAGFPAIRCGRLPFYAVCCSPRFSRCSRDLRTRLEKLGSELAARPAPRERLHTTGAPLRDKLRATGYGRPAPRAFCSRPLRSHMCAGATDSERQAQSDRLGTPTSSRFCSRHSA